MATTALKIKKGDSEIRVKFMTVDKTEYVDVDIYQCNEDFIPIGAPEMGVDARTEEQYHRDLRKEASERGQFVPEQSTNPEWNNKEVSDGENIKRD